MKTGTISVIMLLTLLCSCSQEKNSKKNSGFRRDRFNIGAYRMGPYATSDSHVRDAVDCDIDFIDIPYDTVALRLFEKHGLGAFVHPLESRSNWQSWNDSNIYNFPSIWGLNVRDEPSALLFPMLDSVYRDLDKKFPDKIKYINLFPNYASVAENSGEEALSQLGTRSYAEHISKYCQHVSTDYICYDFYLYHSLINIPMAFDNMMIVSEAARAMNRSMWIVLQVNSYYPEIFMSENQLRYQAYSAMAFGAETIMWGCYYKGWWHNNVLDDNGEKTEQYEKLKTVNREIHRLGEHFMDYRHTYTSFVGYYDTEWLEGLHRPTVPSYSDDYFCDLASEDNCQLLVGTMESRRSDGRRAIFVCASDDPYDKGGKIHRISFKTKGKCSVWGINGEIAAEPDSSGVVTVELRSNSAILIEG